VGRHIIGVAGAIGGGGPLWPRHDPAVDRVIDFTNTGIVVGSDPIKARLDLWRRIWGQAYWRHGWRLEA